MPQWLHLGIIGQIPNRIRHGISFMPKSYHKGYRKSRGKLQKITKYNFKIYNFFLRIIILKYLPFSPPPKGEASFLCKNEPGTAWLSLWESWHGAAVTERALSAQCAHWAPPPKGGGKFALQERTGPNLALPMGELARRKP